MRDYRLHFAQMHLTFGKYDASKSSRRYFNAKYYSQVVVNCAESTFENSLKMMRKSFAHASPPLRVVIIRKYFYTSKPRIWFAHVMEIRSLTKSLLKIQQCFVAILSLYCCMSLCFGNDCRGGWAGICAWVFLVAEQAFALVWMLIKKIE